jgi:hypothetical protein
VCIKGRDATVRERVSGAPNTLPDGRVSAILYCIVFKGKRYEVIKWQNEGGSSIVTLRSYFDKNGDNQFSREEYESSDENAVKGQTQILGGAKFEQFDVNKDGFIGKEDFKILRASAYQAILDKWKANDEEWIWKNYFRVSISLLPVAASARRFCRLAKRKPKRTDLPQPK